MYIFFFGGLLGFLLYAALSGTLAVWAIGLRRENRRLRTQNEQLKHTLLSIPTTELYRAQDHPTPVPVAFPKGLSLSKKALRLPWPTLKRTYRNPGGGLETDVLRIIHTLRQTNLTLGLYRGENDYPGQIASRWSALDFARIPDAWTYSQEILDLLGTRLSTRPGPVTSEVMSLVLEKASFWQQELACAPVPPSLASALLWQYEILFALGARQWQRGSLTEILQLLLSEVVGFPLQPTRQLSAANEASRLSQASFGRVVNLYYRFVPPAAREYVYRQLVAELAAASRETAFDYFDFLRNHPHYFPARGDEETCFAPNIPAGSWLTGLTPDLRLPFYETLERRFAREY